MPEMPEIGNLSVSDAQLCFRQSVRLRADGKKCHPNVRYALYEIALEEAAKGLMILLRRQFRLAGVNFEELARNPRNRPGFENFEACLIRHRALLDEGHFRDAFNLST
jgi:hypothetical protein